MNELNLSTQAGRDQKAQRAGRTAEWGQPWWQETERQTGPGSEPAQEVWRPSGWPTAETEELWGSAAMAVTGHNWWLGCKLTNTENLRWSSWRLTSVKESLWRPALRKVTGQLQWPVTKEALWVADVDRTPTSATTSWSNSLLQLHCLPLTAFGNAGPETNSLSSYWLENLKSCLWPGRLRNKISLWLLRLAHTMFSLRHIME